MTIASDQYEDLTGLVSPPEVGVDLAQPEVARDIPLAIVALCVGLPENEGLRLVRENPDYVGLLPALDAFSTWVTTSHQGDLDSWDGYLRSTRATMLDRALSAYDVAGELSNDERDLIGELIGDSLLGAAIFFSFLNDHNMVSDVDESRWSNLYTWLVIQDLIEAGDEDVSPQESAEEAEVKPW